MTRHLRRTASLTIRAPAKLNVDLRILGRRRDGYHDLRTILQSVELHDTLTLTRRGGPVTVRSRTRAVPRDEANLVWQAAKALWKEAGHPGPPSGAAISIGKRIPMAGGLGGGSSDAAAALRGLCALWGVSLSARRLRDLAAGLGADVPFFLDGGVALGYGRGDRLRRLADLDAFWVVLAVPSFGIPTASAYRWFDATGDAVGKPLAASWRSRPDLWHNDLEAPVVARHPELAGVADRLRSSGATHVAMTGSGSTVYGLFRRRADALAERRRADDAGWRMLLTRTVGREEFASLTAISPRH